VSEVDDEAAIVYSSESIGPLIRKALKKFDNIDEVIKILTPPNNCSWTTARQISKGSAQYLGITESEFMRRWKAMR